MYHKTNRLWNFILLFQQLHRHTLLNAFPYVGFLGIKCQLHINRQINLAVRDDRIS